MKRVVVIATILAIAITWLACAGIVEAATYTTYMYRGQDRQLFPKAGYTLMRTDNGSYTHKWAYINNSSFWPDTVHVFKSADGCAITSGKSASTGIVVVRCR